MTPTVRESDPPRCDWSGRVILVDELLGNQAKRVGVHGNRTARLGRRHREGDVARVGCLAGGPPDDALPSPGGEGEERGGGTAPGGGGAGARGGGRAGDACAHDERERRGTDLRMCWRWL